MSCWCDVVYRYKCIDCEDFQIKSRAALKAYARLCVNDKFDPKIESHRELSEIVIGSGDSPEMLKSDELIELFDRKKLPL